MTTTNDPKDRGMEIYVESAPENFIPELSLRAEYVLSERWNGWLRPVATAEAFGVFLDAWRRNDPNGIWGYVTEVGSALICTTVDSDEPAEAFPRCGETDAGTALYDLTGWNWTDGRG